jgi:peptidoglycan/LPS O-acetylase OafA/YrhL
MIHVSSNLILDTTKTNYIVILLNQLSRFAVPIFFISSGYGLTENNSWKGTYAQYIYKRLSKIFPLYLLWSIIYSCLHLDFTFSKIILNILTGDAEAHLYFLVVLMFFYILYPLLVNVFNTTKKLLILFTASLIFLVFFSFDLLPFQDNRLNPIIWLAYFVIGIYLSKKQDLFLKLLKKSTFLLALGTFFLILDTFISYYILNIPSEISLSSSRVSVLVYTLGILMFIISKYSAPNKILRLFDENSLEVYFVHFIFLTIIDKLLSLFNIENNLFILLLTWAIVSLCSLYFAILSKKLFVFLKLKVSLPKFFKN